jgi:Gpi18-like mannosyltransferase
LLNNTDTSLENSETEPIKPQSRLNEWWRTYRSVVFTWLIVRIGIFLLPLVTLGMTVSEEMLLLPDLLQDRLFGTWARWDGRLFVEIAQIGYERQPLIVFYPVYPHLIRFTGFITGFGQLSTLNLIIVGIIISSFATLVACLLMHKLARLDYSETVAYRSVLYILIFPVSFFLFAVYTESLFLALAVGAFLAARQKRWLIALTLASISVLTRNPGVFLVLALLVEYAQQIGWNPRRLTRQILYFSLPGFALLGWVIYNSLDFNNPTLFLNMQSYWERYPAFPWETVAAIIKYINDTLTTGKGFIISLVALEIPLLILFTFLLIVCIQDTIRGKFRLSYLIFFLGCFVQAIIFPRVTAPLYSFPRFMGILFPAFFCLAALGERYPLLHRAFLIYSLLILAPATLIFGLGYWIA